MAVYFKPTKTLLFARFLSKNAVVLNS